jgi:perosamine synthetase
MISSQIRANSSVGLPLTYSIAGAGNSAVAIEIVSAIRSALPPGPRYPLHEPIFAGNERDYVEECITSGWVSSVGSYVDRFEALVCEVTGAARAVAVVNGTAALQIALLLSDVQPGDEVLVPALTFVATANAISHAGAVPHFIDCESTRLGVDAERLEAYIERVSEPSKRGRRNRSTGRPISALVCVHIFGHPADIDALQKVCAQYDLIMIEDAAESLGSLHHDRHTGRFGRVGALSFNGNKTVTTGGGGALVTDDIVLGDRAKHLTTTARVPDRFEYIHDEIGYNYRMPNLNAALGCAQLERLPYFLRAKRLLAEHYQRAFAGVHNVQLLWEPPRARSNFWLNALILAPEIGNLRDEILGLLQRDVCEARPLWRPMHMLPMYCDCPRMNLAVTEDMYRRVINLPSGVAVATAVTGAD